MSLRGNLYRSGRILQAERIALRGVPERATVVPEREYTLHPGYLGGRPAPLGDSAFRNAGAKFCLRTLRSTGPAMWSAIRP